METCLPKARAGRKGGSRDSILSSPSMVCCGLRKPSESHQEMLVVVRRWLSSVHWTVEEFHAHRATPCRSVGGAAHRAQFSKLPFNFLEIAWIDLNSCRTKSRAHKSNLHAVSLGSYQPSTWTAHGLFVEVFFCSVQAGHKQQMPTCADSETNA